MKTHTIAAGTIHDTVPADLHAALSAQPEALTIWGDLTPLARNEWICWVENAKLIDTRNRHIGRVSNELIEGIRRPCCWIGCIHRTDKAISPSVQGILERRAKTK